LRREAVRLDRLDRLLDETETALEQIRKWLSRHDRQDEVEGGGGMIGV